MDLLILIPVLLFVACSVWDVPRLSVRKDRFMSRDMTCAINGLFIVIVFLSHLKQYIPSTAYGPHDTLYLLAMDRLGQLMVAPFLFFSGYGIMESIKRRKDYVLGLPARRMLPFLIDIWIAVALYLVVRIARGQATTIDEVISAMVGWKSIGNSNWYLFAMLCMYVSTYLSFRMLGRNRWLAVAGVIACCAAYSYVVMPQAPGKWFYDTIFCYPAGMSWSLCLDKVHLFASGSGSGRPTLAAGALALASVVLFCVLYRMRGERAMLFNLVAILFVIIVVLVYGLAPYNGTLFRTFGYSLFYIYIYQRIPMILFSSLSHLPVAYTLLCAATLVPLVLLMRRVHALVKGWLFETAPA